MMKVAAAMLLSLAFIASLAFAAPKSRFTKDIDVHKLDKEWADDDVESDSWHEDTYEWRQKDMKRKQKPFDPKNPDAFLAQAMSGGGMQMLFTTLKEEFHVHKDQTAELAVKWQTLLQTNGVGVKVYPLGANQVIFTQEDGRVMETKAFVLQQPEVLKFRWKDTDYYPEGSEHDPKNQAKGGKKKGAKGKKAKGGKKKAKGGKKKTKKAKKQQPAAEAPKEASASGTPAPRPPQRPADPVPPKEDL